MRLTPPAVMSKLGHMGEPISTPLITAAQAATILGCDVRTINRKAASGALPVVTKLDGIRGPNIFHADAIHEIATQKKRSPVR